MPKGGLPEGTPRHGVLVTRPEPGAAETARQLAALGWDPVLAPALQLEPRPLALTRGLARAQALLLTSRTAARALSPTDLPRELPILAVGEATAAEARRQGCRNVTAAEGDAAALAALATATLDPAAGPLLLAVGTGYGQDLATALRRSGFRVQRRVAYIAAPATALPAAARQALAAGKIVAAMFFSPRSAESTISLLRTAGLAETTSGIVALAISPRVAAALRADAAALAWHAVRIAERPDQDSLLQLLGPR